MLIKSYNLYQLSAKILEGKTFDSHRNWQLTLDKNLNFLLQYSWLKCGDKVICSVYFMNARNMICMIKLQVDDRAKSQVPDI